MKKRFLLIALAALSLFVACSDGSDDSEDVSLTANAKAFVESYQASGITLDTFAGACGCKESETQSGSIITMNYDRAYFPDPLIYYYGNNFKNAFTNAKKTKRIGFVSIDNYDDDASVQGKVGCGYRNIYASNVNLEFSYKDETSSDNGKNWTANGDSKKGYIVCNANRTKAPVGTSTTNYTYTVTDIKCSIKKNNGEWDVSANTATTFKDIIYDMDGTSVTTLANLSVDGVALTESEVTSVINYLSK